MQSFMKLNTINLLLLFLFSTTLLSQTRYPVNVTYVVDGDTFYGNDEAGKRIKFRFIGLDTPEKPRSDHPGEPFHQEATDHLKSLIDDKVVYVEYDVNPRGKYGRDLVYVFLEDGTHINEAMIKAGWAELMTYPPNVKYVEVFREAYRKAREGETGMWKLSN